jgi:hypothetical protein
MNYNYKYVKRVSIPFSIKLFSSPPPPPDDAIRVTIAQLAWTHTRLSGRKPFVHATPASKSTGFKSKAVTMRRHSRTFAYKMLQSVLALRRFAFWSLLLIDRHFLVYYKRMNRKDSTQIWWPLESRQISQTSPHHTNVINRKCIPNLWHGSCQLNAAAISSPLREEPTCFHR